MTRGIDKSVLPTATPGQVGTAAAEGMFAQYDSAGKLLAAALPAAAAMGFQVQTASLTTATAQPTVSSNTFADIHANLSITMTTQGGPLLVFIHGGPSNAAGGVTLNFAAGVDGTTDYPMGSQGTGTAIGVFGMVVVPGLSAGSHTIKARFKSGTNGSTVAALTNLNNDHPNQVIYLTVVELKG